MEKKDFFIGICIGMVAACLGIFIFLFSFTEYTSLSDLKMIRNEGILGKVIALGGVFNLISFFGLLQLKKDLMARGVIMATIILALITIFV